MSHGVADETERSQRARMIVAEVARRRADGEVLDDREVLSAHPDLAVELRAALRSANGIRLARLAALAQQDLSQSSSVAPLPTEGQSIAQANLTVAENRPAITGYTLSDVVGHGSQAVVYAARQQSTGRRVAVKVMAWEPADQSRKRRRFDREIEILATIEHPNIVSVIDRGRTPEGSHFFVMPLIDGPTLAEWVDARRARSDSFLEDVLGLFATIARALETAHQRGIVHRDLKPENLRLDSHGQPMILDFGLARQIRNETDESMFTRLGSVVGSLPWCSPEQAAGGSAELDGRSDVYSLAVMLHHVLTGTFPHPPSIGIRATLGQIISGVAHDRIARTLRSAYPGPGTMSLIATLGKALAMRPEHRYATASAFADDLSRCGTGTQSIAYATRIGRQRRHVLTALAAAATLSLASGLALWGWRLSSNHAALATSSRIELPRLINSCSMMMVRIGPGVVEMGPPPDPLGRPTVHAGRAVRVDEPFWIGMTEVTVDQYRTVMGALSQVAQDGVQDELPVTQVDLQDAEEFCRRLSRTEGRSYRLPTDVEWEYASRAGASYGGPVEYGSVDETAWHSGNSNGRLQRVGAKAANAWGLYDMLGNAAEWTTHTRLDGDRAMHRTGTEDPGYLSGGSIHSTAPDCNPASRMPGPPFRSPIAGFRVVLDASK